MKRKIFLALMGVLLLLYVGVTLFAPIPIFIKYENTVYILLYVFLTYLYLSRGWRAPLMSLLFFNAGRVSRSVLGASGHFSPLAMHHLPLLLLLLIIGFLLYGED